MFPMKNSVYDFLKWLCLIGIPTATTFYVTLDSIFMWGYGDTVAKVSAAVCALIGGLIGISSAQYYKATGSLPMPEDEEEVDNNEVGEG